MSFGVKGGLNISSVTNTQEYGISSSSLAGFYFGVLTEFMLVDKLSIQPEVLYSAQGVKLKFDGEEGDLKLAYILIPVMFKYYVADGFSLELGPQIGFLTSAKVKSAGETIDMKDEVKSTDFGINFGVEYNITSNFFLGARYNLGLTRIQKDLFPGDSESKNSVFQISVGYKF
jgi:opacity protein-like surface antigen